MNVERSEQKSTTIELATATRYHIHAETFACMNGSNTNGLGKERTRIFTRNDASASRIRTFDTCHAIACSFISTEEVTIERLFALTESTQHLNDAQY